MKKSVTRKWVSAVIALTLLLTIVTGCAKKPADSSSTVDASSAGSLTESNGDTSMVDSELTVDTSSLVSSESGIVSGTVSTGISSKASGTTSTVKNDWDKDWAGSSAVVKDLGDIILEDFPVDYSYDWGHCVLKIGDTYKMWFTRQSPWDGVWYAESKDLKHWQNLQCIAKIKSIEDYKTYVKQHIADPAVVYVNGTYHFWFETNMTVNERFEAYGGNAFQDYTTLGNVTLVG
ncbi:MAG: hypothetical protein PUB00_00485 [Clostridiales bacterium]|nr:hypothetical protein [Clostridiales bacterium]